MPKTKCDHCNKEHECPHCWHSTGRILTSMPPQTEEYCCYCDTRITMSMMSEPQPRLQDHGQYYVAPTFNFVKPDAQ